MFGLQKLMMMEPRYCFGMIQNGAGSPMLQKGAGRSIKSAYFRLTSAPLKLLAFGKAGPARYCLCLAKLIDLLLCCDMLFKTLIFCCFAVAVIAQK